MNLNFPSQMRAFRLTDFISCRFVICRCTVGPRGGWEADLPVGRKV